METKNKTAVIYARVSSSNDRQDKVGKSRTWKIMLSHKI